MDPHHAAFPLAVNEDTIESRTGITYRQWMIGQVASGYLANKGVDLEEVRCSNDRKWEVIGHIIEVADGLIREEEDMRILQEGKEIS